MNCIKAENLIMDYIDNNLSSSEAEKLNEHLKNCENCREAFNIYEMMVDNFENLEFTSPPDDFEEKLMIKINAITPAYLNQKQISLDNIHSVIWGIFTIFFGFGIMLNMYRDSIITYLSQNEFIAEFYSVINPLANLVSDYINEIFVYVENITISMNGVLIYSKIICGILIAVLCFVQVWLKRSKVDA